MKQNSTPPYLPELIQSMILNLECGTTLEKSISVIMDQKHRDEGYMALYLLYQKSNSGLLAINAMAQTLEDYFFWRFTQNLNQYHTTGSAASIEALKMLYQEIWREKHDRMKAKSEQISVILTFLLMLSLISVIIVVISPILMDFMIFT